MQIFISKTKAPAWFKNMIALKIKLVIKYFYFWKIKTNSFLNLANGSEIKPDELLIIEIVSLKDEYKNKIYSREFFNISEYYLNENNYTNNTLFRVNYTNTTFSDPRNFSMFYVSRPSLVIEVVQIPQLLSMPRDIRLYIL